MFTVDEYLNHWKVNYSSVKVDPAELTEVVLKNAEDLIQKVNELLKQTYDSSYTMNSGWRPREVNLKVAGAASNSPHMRGCAVDVGDAAGKLDAWCMNNLDKLSAVGLYLEHPSATPGWTHLQSVPPKSGRRVFYP